MTLLMGETIRITLLIASQPIPIWCDGGHRKLSPFAGDREPLCSPSIIIDHDVVINDSEDELLCWRMTHAEDKGRLSFLGEPSLPAHYFDVLKDFTVVKNFDLEHINRIERRVTMECWFEKCRWPVHSSIAKGAESLSIGKLCSERTCHIPRTGIAKLVITPLSIKVPT